MKRPTAPVPLKERVTSRSLISSLGVHVTSILDIAKVFEIDPGTLDNIALHAVAAAIFAVGYARDVAMAWIEAKAEARGVSFEDAQEEAKTIPEDLTPLVRLIRNIEGRQDELEREQNRQAMVTAREHPPVEQNIPRTLTPEAAQARSDAAAAAARAMANPDDDDRVGP